MPTAFRSLFLALGPVLFAASAPARDAGGCDGTAPSLDHSAPHLGQVLTLTLGGAPPGAAVRLFFSPDAGSLATPFGLLELDRAGLLLAASGFADPSGAWTADLPLPLDPLLAEVEGHYQALVSNASGTAALALSDAVHLRFLGPRSYSLCSGIVSGLGSTGLPGHVVVHSIVDGTQAASLELDDKVGNGWFGGPPKPWQPAISTDLARGACVPRAQALVVFDNFDGSEIVTLPVERASPTLIGAPDGRHAYVLDRIDDLANARIRVLDLETASLVGSLDLPGRSPGLWVEGELPGQVFVSELDATTGRTLARRVDLVGMQVLGSLPLGDAASVGFRWMAREGEWLYASTFASGPTGLTGFFTAVRPSDPTGSKFVPFSSSYVSGYAVVPASGLLLLSSNYVLLPSSDALLSAPLGDPTNLTPVSIPQGWFLFGQNVVRDQVLWILANACPGCPGPTDDGEPAILWRLDTSNFSWRRYPTEWWDGPPIQLLPARSALADLLLLPRDGQRPAIPPLDPGMMTLDPENGRDTGTWELDWGVVSTFVLDLP